MSRRNCPTCGPETLFAGSICVNCGHDIMRPKQRPKRVRFNAEPSTLRHPVVDTDSNLLSLMAAKQ